MHLQGLCGPMLCACAVFMFFTSSNRLCDQHQMWSDLANQWRVPRQSKHPVALSPIRRCNGLRGANFDIVVVHFAFAANKTLQWLKWHNFDISCRPLSLCYQHLGEAHRDGPRRDGGRPDSKSRFPVAQGRCERYRGTWTRSTCLSCCSS